MALVYTNLPNYRNYVVGKVLEEIDKGLNVSFLKRLSSVVYQWPKKVLIEPVEKDQVVCFYKTLKLAKSG